MNRPSIINSQPTMSSCSWKEDEPPRPEAKAFRRRSLEYTRQNSDKKLAAGASSSSTTTTSDQKVSDPNNPAVLGSISASRRRPRRSSLKTASTSSTDTTASNSTSSLGSNKFVTFSLDVNVRPIAPKSEAELKVLWLSKDERQAIQLQANADLKVLKRIAKIPKEVQSADPEIRAVRSSISIRGLEQFSSKRLHKALWALQHDHLKAVLEAQDVQLELNRRYGHPIKDTELAKVSMERSELSRDRATKQGKEDEAAVMGYLGRSARTTTYTSSSPSSTLSDSSGSNALFNDSQHRSRSTSQGLRTTHYHHRRGSMPTTSVEMERAATRRSSCSTTPSVAAPSNSTNLFRSTSAISNVQTARSHVCSRSNSMSHGMKRIQSSVDSLLTRVASSTLGDNQNKNTLGPNASFDNEVRPPSSICTPKINKEDTVLLEPFVYPRLSGSRRNTVI